MEIIATTFTRTERHGGLPKGKDSIKADVTRRGVTQERKLNSSMGQKPNEVETTKCM
jgi:hypothetical protein